MGKKQKENNEKIMGLMVCDCRTQLFAKDIVVSAKATITKQGLKRQSMILRCPKCFTSHKQKEQGVED